MDTKEIKITPPEGYEIDKSKSTFTNIVFKKLPKEDKLPVKWEDLKMIKGFYADECSDIYEAINVETIEGNENVFATEEQVQASIALAKLSQLKKVYNGDWEPNWADDNKTKYTIIIIRNDIKIDVCWGVNRFLAFKTSELRDEFLMNFKDLIEQAKPLLG